MIRGCFVLAMVCHGTEHVLGGQRYSAYFAVATCFEDNESYSPWPVRVALRSCAEGTHGLCKGSRGDRRLIQRNQEKHHAYLFCPSSWRCSLRRGPRFCGPCKRSRRGIVRSVRDRLEHQVRNARRGRMRHFMSAIEFHRAMLGRALCRLQWTMHRFGAGLVYREL